MFHAAATIRDYNPTNDTATVELSGWGVIDTWFDGVAIDASLNRSFITHGVTVTVATTDPHAICQGTVIGINTSPALVTQRKSTALRRIQTGRSSIQADGAGAGSATVTFPVAFLNATDLSVYAGADDGTTLTVLTPTATQVGIQISGATPNAYVYFSWHAEGNK
jgi:hypothetical protein